MKTLDEEIEQLIRMLPQEGIDNSPIAENNAEKITKDWQSLSRFTSKVRLQRRQSPMLAKVSAAGQGGWRCQPLCFHLPSAMQIQQTMQENLHQQRAALTFQSSLKDAPPILPRSVALARKMPPQSKTRCHYRTRNQNALPLVPTPVGRIDTVICTRL